MCVNDTNIQVVNDVVVFPSGSFPQNPFSGGVCYPNGEVIESAIHSHARKVPHKPIFEGSVEGHYETAIYGGFLMSPHFGHIVTESLGRLWGISKIDSSVDTIIFIPGLSSRKIPDFFSDLLRGLGVDLNVVMLTDAVSVERLFIPSQLFGLGALLTSHQSFISFSQKIFANSEMVGSSSKKIYVSRGKYRVDRGGILCESVLEENLINHGYKIIYPELLSVEEQAVIYRNAEVLLFSEGSALHYYGLMAQPTQKVGIISTRKNASPFRRQIHSFSGKKPAVFIAHERFLIPSEHRFPFANSAVHLDFSKLKNMLENDGFIDPSDELWRSPSEMEIDRCVEEFSDVFDGKVYSNKVLATLAPE